MSLLGMAFLHLSKALHTLFSHLKEEWRKKDESCYKALLKLEYHILHFRRHTKTFYLCIDVQIFPCHPYKSDTMIALNDTQQAIIFIQMQLLKERNEKRGKKKNEKRICWMPHCSKQPCNNNNRDTITSNNEQEKRELFHLTFTQILCDISSFHTNTHTFPFSLFSSLSALKNQYIKRCIIVVVVATFSFYFSSSSSSSFLPLCVGVTWVRGSIIECYLKAHDNTMSMLYTHTLY